MTDSQRPDPAALLARIKRDEVRSVGGGGMNADAANPTSAQRGRLKIFFGMSPGVGKTYAMLAAAQRLATQGVDVVIGVVETHGRSETEQMTLGLDVIPRREIKYRGGDGQSAPVRLVEFDLDAAIRRKPDVLLVDELAHSNPPGMGEGGHEKRWQDVQACLAAGINVYTTVNVQHVESLIDIVAQITGVVVRETIPDSVIDQADEIELVDLPPGALLERLRAGKVYVPEAAKHAINSFFRAGNLTALRQLALRRTAEWVDQRMRDYKEDKNIRAVWAAAERILVAVSPSPMAPKLVRAAKRMAAGLRAELLAVYVEGPNADRLPQTDRDRVLQTLRLAESLGAETATMTCGADAERANPATELVAFARSRNVNRIVIGKTQKSRSSEALSLLFGWGAGSFSSEVLRVSGDIDVYVIQGDTSDDPDTATRLGTTAAPRNSPTFQHAASPTFLHRLRLPRYLNALAAMAVSSALAMLAYRPPDLSEESMLLLGGVFIVALWLGRGPAVFASVLAVLAFNYFFTEPRFTLYVSDSGFLVTFAVMLGVGITVGTLAARSRRQAETARDREQRTASLYAMARELAAAHSLAETARTACRHIATAFKADVVVAVASPASPEGIDVIGWGGSSPDWFAAAPADGLTRCNNRSVARWALDNGKPAGFGTATLAAAAGRFLPLSTTQGRVGVLGVRPANPDAAQRLITTDRLLLLDTFAGQVAAALERVRLIDGREAARIDAESERLRSALLSSVSHDLRTPLAGIAGAASTLAESGDLLDSSTRADLLASIVSEAQRLNDLIANLVFATRLESGSIEVNREWTTVEEIVGSGLARHRDALSRRTVRTTGISRNSHLPMIKVDNAMLPMVVHNLIENALRYTPESVPISVSAWQTENTVVIKVADEGPGLAKGEATRVFQRFYRGRTAKSASAGSEPAEPESRPIADLSGNAGMGLGLTICDGIIKAHGGRIWAEPNSPKGVAFLFSLPLDEPQPPIPEDTDDPPQLRPLLGRSINRPNGELPA